MNRGIIFRLLYVLLFSVILLLSNIDYDIIRYITMTIFIINLSVLCLFIGALGIADKID